MHQASRRPSRIRALAATAAAVALTAISAAGTAVPATASPAGDARAAHRAASWPKAARIFVGVSNLLYSVNPSQHSHSLAATLDGNITSITASQDGRQLVIVTVPTFGVENVWVRSTAAGAASTLVYTSGTKTGWVHDVWLRKGKVFFEAESLGSSGQYYIYSVKTDGSGFARHRQGSQKLLPDTLSPNARRIAHPSPKRFAQPSVLTLASRVSKKLPVGPVGGLEWSPNSRWIAYNQAGHKTGGLGIVHPTGKGSRVVLAGDAASYPHPSYGTPTWSYDSRHLLAVRFSTTKAPRLVSVAPLARHPRQVRVPGLPRGFRGAPDSPVAWARFVPLTG